METIGLHAKARRCAEYLRSELSAVNGVEEDLEVYPAREKVFITGDKTRCFITVEAHPYTQDGTILSIEGVVCRNAEDIELQTATERPSRSDDKRRVQFPVLDDFESVKRLALLFFIA